MTQETIVIKKSRDKKHKLEAHFSNGKVVRFGAKGYSDYTVHKDRDRMKRYIARHRGREDWSPAGQNTAGFLSRWILWSEPDIHAAAARTGRLLKKNIVIA